MSTFIDLIDMKDFEEVRQSLFENNWKFPNIEIREYFFKFVDNLSPEEYLESVEFLDIILHVGKEDLRKKMIDRFAYDDMYKVGCCRLVYKPLLEKMERIYNQYSIPLIQYPDVHHLFLANQYFIEQGFDLVIGIHTRGSMLPFLIDLHGDIPVKIIEYHRSWKKKEPFFRKLGLQRPTNGPFKKVVICENDIASGTTLNKVIPFIQKKFNPKEIHISLHGFPSSCVSIERIEHHKILKSIFHCNKIKCPGPPFSYYDQLCFYGSFFQSFLD